MTLRADRCEQMSGRSVRNFLSLRCPKVITGQGHHSAPERTKAAVKAAVKEWLAEQVGALSMCPGNKNILASNEKHKEILTSLI